MVRWGGYWKKNKGLFLSFVAVAALLPAMLVGVTSPGALRVLTSASEETSLRLWFEPEAVVTSPGQTIRLKLVAEYDDKNKLVPRAEMAVRAEGLDVTPSNIVYDKSFVGRVVLAEIWVTTKLTGTYQVGVVETSVNTGLPDLGVITNPAKITVR
jgi:hypothetical protein